MKKLLLVALISFISYAALSQSCLPDGVVFTTQKQIDNFRNDYPGCSEIEGNLLIYGTGIYNLTGLNVLTSIGGYLEIICTQSLINLSGLENLTHIGSHLRIEENYALKNLTGLDNLSSVGGDLRILYNEFLVSLNGLSKLNSISEFIEISHNPALTSLLGLEKINPSSINDLFISYNNSLANCNVQFICDYLTGISACHIYYNSVGCNCQEEVRDSCGILSVHEISLFEDVILKPNPLTNSTTLSYELQQPEKVILCIYNQMGKQVYQTQVNQPQGKQQLIWNAHEYADGIYSYRLQAGEQTANGKMVKVR